MIWTVRGVHLEDLARAVGDMQGVSNLRVRGRSADGRQRLWVDLMMLVLMTRR
jgi:hypothetical protein